MPSRRRAAEWSTADVVRWLGQNGLSAYAPKFTRAKVTGIDLLTRMNDTSLDKLNLPRGPLRDDFLVQLEKLKARARRVTTKPQRAPRAEKVLGDRSGADADYPFEKRVAEPPAPARAPAAVGHRVEAVGHPPRRRRSSEHLTRAALHNARVASDGTHPTKTPKRRPVNEHPRSHGALHASPGHTYVVQPQTQARPQQSAAKRNPMPEQLLLVQDAPGSGQDVKVLQRVHVVRRQPPPASGGRPVAVSQQPPQQFLQVRRVAPPPFPPTSPRERGPPPERLTAEMMRRALREPDNQEHPVSQPGSKVSFAPTAADGTVDHPGKDPHALSTDAIVQSMESDLTNPDLPADERMWIEANLRKARKRRGRANTNAVGPGQGMDRRSRAPVGGGSQLTQEEVAAARLDWQNQRDQVVPAAAGPAAAVQIAAGQSGPAGHEALRQSMMRAAAALKQQQEQAWHTDGAAGDAERLTLQAIDEAHRRHDEATRRRVRNAAPQSGPQPSIEDESSDEENADASVGHRKTDAPLRVSRLPRHGAGSLLYNEFGEAVDPTMLGIGGAAVKPLFGRAPGILGFHIVRRRNGRFGFNIDGGPDVSRPGGRSTGPPFVTKVDENGPAYGTVQANDILVALNGLPCAGLSHSALVWRLKSTPSSVMLLEVRRPPRRETQMVPIGPAAVTDGDAVQPGVPAPPLHFRNFNGSFPLGEAGNLVRQGIVVARASEIESFMRYHFFLFENALVLAQPSHTATGGTYDFVHMQPIEAISEIDEVDEFTLGRTPAGEAHGWSVTTGDATIVCAVDTFPQREQWVNDTYDVIERKWTLEDVTVRRDTADSNWDLSIALLSEYSRALVVNVAGRNQAVNSLLVSDEIVEVNSEPIHGSSEDQIRQLMEAAGTTLKLTVRRLEHNRDRNRVTAMLMSLATADLGDHFFRKVSIETEDVHIVRADAVASYGFRFGIDSHTGDVMVCAVDIQSPSNLHVFIGDVILEVNGVSVNGKVYDEIVALVQSSTAIDLKVRRLSAVPMENLNWLYANDVGIFRRPEESTLSLDGGSLSGNLNNGDAMSVARHPTTLSIGSRISTIAPGATLTPGSALAPPQPPSAVDLRIPGGRHTLSVTLHRQMPNASYGFDLATLPDYGHYICEVDVASDSAGGQVFIADRIVAINGQRLTNVAHHDVVSLFETGALHTTIEIERSTDSLGNLPDEPKDITKHVGSGQPSQPGGTASLPLSPEMSDDGDHVLGDPFAFDGVDHQADVAGGDGPDLAIPHAVTPDPGADDADDGMAAKPAVSATEASPPAAAAAAPAATAAPAAPAAPGGGSDDSTASRQKPSDLVGDFLDTTAEVDESDWAETPSRTPRPGLLPPPTPDQVRDMMRSPPPPKRETPVDAGTADNGAFAYDDVLVAEHDFEPWKPEFETHYERQMSVKKGDFVRVTDLLNFENATGWTEVQKLPTGDPTAEGGQIGEVPTSYLRHPHESENHTILGWRKPQTKPEPTRRSKNIFGFRRKSKPSGSALQGTQGAGEAASAEGLESDPETEYAASRRTSEARQSQGSVASMSMPPLPPLLPQAEDSDGADVVITDEGLYDETTVADAEVPYMSPAEIRPRAAAASGAADNRVATTGDNTVYTSGGLVPDGPMLPPRQQAAPTDRGKGASHGTETLTVSEYSNLHPEDEVLEVRVKGTDFTNDTPLGDADIKSLFDENKAGEVDVTVRRPVTTYEIEFWNDGNEQRLGIQFHHEGTGTASERVEIASVHPKSDARAKGLTVRAWVYSINNVVFGSHEMASFQNNLEYRSDLLHSRGSSVIITVVGHYLLPGAEAQQSNDDKPPAPPPDY